MTIQNKLTVQIREMEFQGSDYKTSKGDKINLEDGWGKLEARPEDTTGMKVGIWCHKNRAMWLTKASAVDWHEITGTKEHHGYGRYKRAKTCNKNNYDHSGQSQNSEIEKDR